MIEIMFTLTNSGVKRARGYATVPYSSDNENETVAETTKADLATLFEQAKTNGETVDGADASIDAAVGDPLSYLDFLILDSDDAILFDSDYTRQTPTSG
jgi:hypothetical protein